jgi:nucleoside-diphosphate-sugar epimerase
MSPASPPVLVLGASSLIGEALDNLPRRPALLRVSRRAPPGPNWVQADLGQSNALNKANCHNKGITQALGLAPIWVTAPVVPQLADLGVRRIVAFSSTSRWTKQDSTDAHEREVADRLARSEDLLIQSCQDRGIDWTLLRPTLIYLEGRDGNVTRLAGLIRRFGALPLAGGGTGRRQPVHAADLATGALSALLSEAAYNRAYDLPGGETLTYRQMCERIFRAVNRRPMIVDVPPPVWKLGFSLARPLLPGATAAMGARMEEDLVFDGAAAREDFGWNPRPFQPSFQTVLSASVKA